MSHETTSGRAPARAGGAPDTDGGPLVDPVEPDSDRLPDSPTDLTKPSWAYTLTSALREFQKDEVTDLAAALTYWAVLAVAPAVIALISLLGVVGDGEEIVAQVIKQAEAMAPGQDFSQIKEILNDLASQERAGLALVAGLVLALWSASGYVNAFSRAMNRIYGVREGRPIWKLRPWMLLVTLVVLVLVALICIALALSGPVAAGLGELIGLSELTVTVWNIAKWPVVLLLVALTVAILYWATPNLRMPSFRWISVGSFVAILAWVVGTAGFGFYVTRFGSYEKTYGALAGFIVFLLWLWLTNNALLVGAEIDSELERSRQLQAGVAAEERIQLPYRDESGVRKKERKQAEAVARARELRLSRGGDPGADQPGPRPDGRPAAP